MTMIPREASWKSGNVMSDNFRDGYEEYDCPTILLAFSLMPAVHTIYRGWKRK